jgi:CRP-like cAMP-binding protein
MADDQDVLVKDEAPLALTREQVTSRLRDVALFQGLGTSDLAEILRISETIRVDGGEYIFEEGERGDHFFIIVHGTVELRKASGGERKRLAVLRAGQAFGEMALLNQTPRSASAYALEDTYMLSVSRAAFSQMLGGDTLSVRLLKNLSKALWATSVRLASQQARSSDSDTGHETLAEFNRLLRARLLPRVTPRVSGYDLSASTLAPRQGSGSTAWDWFVLTDGRPAFAVTKAMRGDLFSAQRLAAVRQLLRSLAGEPLATLGVLLTKVNRGLKAGWIEGLSGPVAVGLVALADGAAEWVEAGPITSVLARSNGTAEDLSAKSPPIGEDPDHSYESTILVLGPRDRVVALTDSHDQAAETVSTVLTEGYVSTSRDALAKVLGQVEPSRVGEADPSDVSAIVISRTAR